MIVAVRIAAVERIAAAEGFAVVAGVVAAVQSAAVAAVEASAAVETSAAVGALAAVGKSAVAVEVALVAPEAASHCWLVGEQDDPFELQGQIVGRGGNQMLRAEGTMCGKQGSWCAEIEPQNNPRIRLSQSLSRHPCRN